MLFGLYAPVPHVTVGSPEVARAVREAAGPLPNRALDQQYLLSRDVLTAADRSGFDIALFAERHLGADLEAWMLAGAIGPMLKRTRSLVAVHPGLWSPQIIAKMAATLDRMCPARMAINLVTGWNVEEHRMFGGDAMSSDDERYVRAEEFVTSLRGLWTETPFSFKGRYYDVDAAELLLKPASPDAAGDLHREPLPTRPRHGRSRCRLVVPRLRQGRALDGRGRGKPSALDRGRRRAGRNASAVACVSPSIRSWRSAPRARPPSPMPAGCSTPPSPTPTSASWRTGSARR